MYRGWNHSVREGSASLLPQKYSIEIKLRVKKFSAKKTQRMTPQLWWLLDRVVSVPWNPVAYPKCVLATAAWVIGISTVCTFCTFLVSSEHQNHAQGGLCVRGLWMKLKDGQEDFQVGIPSADRKQPLPNSSSYMAWSRITCATSLLVTRSTLPTLPVGTSDLNRSELLYSGLTDSNFQG